MTASGTSTIDPAHALVGLLDHLTELPSHPGASLGILSAIDDPRSNATGVARLVDADPALSASVLRLANSAVYGFARQVTSSPRAVSIIGFDSVRSLAVLAASGAFSDPGNKAPAAFWGHSVATASGAAVIARRCGVQPNEAFSAGLLHDLGAALLYQVDPLMAENRARDFAHDPASLFATERGVYGMDHGEAGAAVLEAWGFPDVMVRVQRDHHHVSVDPANDLVRIVRAGEALATLGGAPTIVEPVADPADALIGVGIAADEIDALSRQAISEAESLVALLLG